MHGLGTIDIMHDMCRFCILKCRILQLVQLILHDNMCSLLPVHRVATQDLAIIDLITWSVEVAFSPKQDLATIDIIAYDMYRLLHFHCGQCRILVQLMSFRVYGGWCIFTAHQCMILVQINCTRFSTVIQWKCKQHTHTIRSIVPRSCTGARWKCKQHTSTHTIRSIVPGSRLAPGENANNIHPVVQKRNVWFLQMLFLLYFGAIQMRSFHVEKKPSGNSVSSMRAKLSKTFFLEISWNFGHLLEWSALMLASEKPLHFEYLRNHQSWTQIIRSPSTSNIFWIWSMEFLDLWVI